MKELSIEEKAKAYDEALKVANKYKDTHIMFPLIKDEMFPELKESEDEMVRRWIINYLDNKALNSGIIQEKTNIKNAIAWLEKQAEHAKFIDSIQIGDQVTRNQDSVLVNLSQLKRVAKKDEKQGEQKLSELPKGEDYGIDGLYHAISILEKTLGKVDGYQSDDGILEHKCAISAVKKLYEQKPAWSEEDDIWLNNLICHFETGLSIEHERVASWLKSLKDRVQPQNTWKPSDEQMMYLAKAITTLGDEGDCKTASILNDLRVELKKLRGE